MPSKRRSKSPAVRGRSGAAKKSPSPSPSPRKGEAEPPLVPILSKYTPPFAIAVWLATSMYIVIEGRRGKDGDTEATFSGLSTVSGLALACIAIASHKESETKTRLMMIPVALSCPVWFYKLDIIHVRSFAGVIFIITCAVVASVLIDDEDGWNIWRMFFDDDIAACDPQDDRARAKKGKQSKGGNKATLWALFRLMNWAMACSFVVCTSCALYERFDENSKIELWESSLVPRATWSLLSFCYLFGAFFATKLAN